MPENTTVLISHPYVPREVAMTMSEVCQITIEFTEDGWRVLKDNRPTGYNVCGYLHVIEGVSAEAVTDAVRDQIIRYYYNHPKNLPGIGATPQTQYMNGLTIEDRERIGNDGALSFYC